VNAQGQLLPSLPVAAALILDGTQPSAVRSDGGTLSLGRRKLPLVTQEVPDFYGAPQLARRMLV